jgi:PhnB protein
MTRDQEIPAVVQTVIPYLILKDASKFIAFTEKVFNATQAYKVMRDENIIMHAEIIIGESKIMFADVTDKYKTQCAGLFVYVKNADETYKIAIEAGATILSELSDQPYGRSGGVTDPFGNTWWITSIKTN